MAITLTIRGWATAPRQRATGQDTLDVVESRQGVREPVNGLRLVSVVQERFHAVYLVAHASELPGGKVIRHGSRAALGLLWC